MIWLSRIPKKSVTYNLCTIRLEARTQNSNSEILFLVAKFKVSKGQWEACFWPSICRDWGQETEVTDLVACMNTWHWGNKGSRIVDLKHPAGLCRNRCPLKTILYFLSFGLFEDNSIFSSHGLPSIIHVWWVTLPSKAQQLQKERLWIRN